MSDPTRRQILYFGSAAAAAAAILPGCEQLVLPTAPLLHHIEPITPTADFYVYQHSLPAMLDEQTWELTFSDRGTDMGTVTLDDLDAMQSDTFEHTLECIGSGPRVIRINNAEWTGVPLSDVLDALGITVDPSIVEIVMHGGDNYATSVPISDLDAPIRLVWRMNGDPLPPQHGAPARLLVPGRYGTKNVKWVQRIELTDTPFLGFWEQQGWSNAATYQTSGYVLSPGQLATVDFGPVTFLGVAYAGLSPIARVQASLDDGATWQDAHFDYQGGPNVWSIWSFDFDPPHRGTYTLRLRVTAEDGTVASKPDATHPLNGYDGAMQVQVEFV